MKAKHDLIPSGMFAPSTFYMYKTHYDCYLSKIIGDKDVRLIDGADLDSLTAALVGKSKHYKINVFSTLHSFMVWTLRKKKWIKDLPEFPGFGNALSQSRKRESLTVEEQEAAFALIPERHRPIFIFASEVGCRPGETGLIRLEDIDRNGVLHITRTFSRYQEMDRTKDGAIRHITLSDVALDIVKGQMVDPSTGAFRTTGLLFKNPDGKPRWGPYRPAFLLKLWRETVGYDYPDHYAATRTSFATQLAETGELSEKKWRATTGHTSQEAADRYFHQRQTRQRSLLNSRRKSSSQIVIPFKKSRSLEPE